MTQKTKILLIEDSALSQKIFNLALSKLELDKGRIEQETASSVNEAISKINNGFRPAIVFLDWKLGGESGKVFLYWVRHQTFPEWVQFLTIYVLSSSSSKADIKTALCSPMANAYFVKPTNLSELANIISLSLRFGETTRQV